MRSAVDGVTASGKTAFADRLAQLVPGVARITIGSAVVAAPTPLIADGVFLLHPELRDLWDVAIFLRCDREVARERGIARDASWLEDARERYAARYVPGESRYLEEVDPESLADVVLDTTDPARPRLVIDSDP